MKGKIGLEEHFAIDDTLMDSKGFFPEETWIEVRDSIMDLHGRRLRLMDEFGMEMMILSLNAPAIQAIPDAKKANEIARKANDYLAEQVKKRPDRFQALAALLEEMHEANTDYARFIEADIAFHKLLSEASGNSVFADVLSRIHLLLRVWIQRVFEDAGETAYSYRRHLAIFQAIEAGDANAAEQAMAEHMESAIARLRRTLENTGIAVDAT